MMLQGEKSASPFSWSCFAGATQQEGRAKTPVLLETNPKHSLVAGTQQLLGYMSAAAAGQELEHEEVKD